MVAGTSYSLPRVFARLFYLLRSRLCQQTLGQKRPGKTFRDDKRIVPQRCKKLAQYLGLLSVLRHTIHLCL